MQHWHVSLNAGTQRRRMKMAALFMEGWGMESLLGGPRWDLCSSLSSISSQERGILFWNFIWTFFITSAQVYLGSDFRSILTGMVSIDARGRVGVQEVKKRQICENKNRKTRERVGVQQQKIPCLVSYPVEIGFCPYFSSKILFPGGIRKATRGSFDQAWSSVAEKLLLTPTSVATCLELYHWNK